MAEETGTAATAANEHPNWDARVKAFADAVGKDTAAVSVVLKGLVGDPTDQKLEILSSEDSIPDSDLEDVLVKGELKIPKAIFRHNRHLLRGKPEAKAKDAAVPTTGVKSSSVIDVLPVPPEGEAFVEALKAGGVQKVDSVTILAAARASFAEKAGLYDVPVLLMDAIEKHDTEMKQPSSDLYYKVRKLTHQRKYADILTALNIESAGSFVTNPRKEALLSKVNQVLWSSLESFQGSLMAWRDGWMSDRQDMLLMAIAGNIGGVSPVFGAFTQPDSGPVRAAAEAVVESTNAVFAGTGIPIAKALAADANRVKGILADTSLPAAIGAGNMEEMLNKLGVAVTASYVRMEGMVARYLYGVLELSKLIQGGPEEMSYLLALSNLGKQVDWSLLRGAASSRPRTPRPFGAPDSEVEEERPFAVRSRNK